MTTFKQIQTDLAAAGKPSSAAQVRRYLKKLEIQTKGARQRPQKYAPDSAARIIAHLDGQEPGTAIISFNELKKQTPNQ